MIAEFDNSLLVQARQMRSAYLKSLFSSLLGYRAGQPAHA